jgi:phenylpropionate dioxygenase-like ring-hydroxylating dioxygenase large terminal subunit
MNSTQFGSHQTILPADFYYRPDIFEKEKEKVLKKNWLYAGKRSNLQKEGDFYTTEVLGVPILVWLTKSGLKAFVNVCAHRGAQLKLETTGCVNALSCHYHGWTWDQEGSLKRAPGERLEENLEKCRYPLTQLAVGELSPFVFIHFEQNPIPFEVQFQVLLEAIRKRGIDYAQLVYQGSTSYRMKCNWKTVVENFLECYHCPVSHPSFCNLINMTDYEVKTYERHSTQYGYLRHQGESENETETQRDQYGIYNFIYPLFMVNTYPGQGNASTNRIEPIGPEETLVTYEFFLDPTMSSEEVEKNIALVHEVQLEDVTICESVFRGLKSGFYQSGWLMKAENGVHHFQDLLSRDLFCSPLKEKDFFIHSC